MIVADANVLVYQAIDSPAARWAHEWAEIDPHWFLPSLWRFEFTNAIRTMVKAGEVAPDQGALLIADTITAYGKRELPVDQVDVLRTAVQYRIAAYDANYIVLA